MFFECSAHNGETLARHFLMIFKKWHVTCASIGFALEKRKWKIFPEVSVPGVSSSSVVWLPHLGGLGGLLLLSNFYFNHHCHRSLLDVLVEILQIFKKQN